MTTRTTVSTTWSSMSTYTEANVLRLVPRQSGVYLVCEPGSSNDWRVAYVGRAENLEQRLLAHLQASEPNGCLRSLVSRGSAAVWWASVPTWQTAGVEKYLYDHYQPRCNAADPGGTPMTVNLP